jgi:hypothetical protein
MLLSTAVTLVWIIPNVAWGRPYFLGVEPIYPGLAASSLVYAWSAFAARKGRRA